MTFIFDVRVLRLEISVFHYDRPCSNEEFCTADLVLYYLPMINSFQLLSNFVTKLLQAKNILMQMIKTEFL